MAFIIVSCKDCSDRYPGCHGKCETYKRERAEHDKRKAVIDAHREARIYWNNSKANRANNMAIRRKERKGYNGFHK